MKLEAVSRHPLSGALNENNFYRDLSGGLYIKKNPRDNPIIWNSIADEYKQIGFTGLGGQYRLRSIQEQKVLCNKMAGMGLRVLRPLETGDDSLLFPYLSDAYTLDLMLEQATEEQARSISTQLISDIYNAHRHNVVYGDRWSHNILIVPIVGVVQIDFDIALSGKPAKEFDMAQAIYYALCGGREKVVERIAALTGSLVSEYNMAWIETFLRGHAERFRETEKFGQADDLIEHLISHMYSFGSPVIYT